MQKLFENTNGRSKSEHKLTSSVKRFFACAFAGLALLASPMLAHQARAQPPPSAEIGAHSLEGTKVTLKNGKQKEEVYFCAHSINRECVLNVNGPAEVTVFYYPIIPKVSFKTSGPIRISYSLDGTNFDQDAQTELSTLRTTDIDLDKSLGIGVPIEISFTALEGSHKFIVLTPKGFLKVSNVSEQIPMPDLVPLPPPEVAARLDAPPNETSKGSAGDSTTTQGVSLTAKTEKPKELDRPVVSLESDILRFDGIGENNNAGHVGNLDIVGKLSFDDRFGLLLGAYVKIYRLALDKNNHETDVDLTSVGVLVGPSFVLKPGSVFSVMLLGGTQSTGTDVNTNEELQGTTVDRKMPIEVGLRLQYDSSLLQAMLEATTNPINPGTLRLAHNAEYVTLPTGTHPKLDLDMRLLHLLRPNQNETPLGSSVDDRNVYLEALAELPFTYRAVTASLLGGGESLVDASSRSTHASGLAGLGLEFHIWRLRIGGRALVNPAHLEHLPRAMITAEFLSERTVE